MNILAELQKRFLAALAGMVDDPAELVQLVRPSQDPKFGDYQANFAMSLAKVLGKKPRDIAQDIVQHLETGDLLQPPEIAGPGFINLRLQTGWMAQRVQEMAKDERLGVAFAVHDATEMPLPGAPVDARSLERHAQRQQPLRVEADRHVRQPRKALQQQARADQQHERQRHLGDHEDVRRAAARGGGAASTGPERAGRRQRDLPVRLRQQVPDQGDRVPHRQHRRLTLQARKGPVLAEGRAFAVRPPGGYLGATCSPPRCGRRRD